MADKKQKRKFGMDEGQLMTLATFNAERGRGLVHTPEWEAKMEHLQRIFNWHSKLYLGTPIEEIGPPPPRVYVPPGQLDAKDKLGTEPEGPRLWMVALVSLIAGAVGGLIQHYAGWPL